MVKRYCLLRRSSKYQKSAKVSVSNRKDLKEKIVVEFKKLGFAVERQGFGTVIIDVAKINEATNYLNNDAEYAAMYAVPKVLKRGVEITNREKHKDRTYNTVTFAAPVIINGVRGNVAVVVKKTKGNRYKTHRIVAPNGCEFVFNKKQEQKLWSAA